MGINIKNERVQRLARELATATGRSMTGAIEQALESELARLQRSRELAERKRKVREIVESFGPVPEGLSSDHSDFYDERGLPR
jgi:antitoxin VapB